MTPIQPQTPPFRSALFLRISEDIQHLNDTELEAVVGLVADEQFRRDCEHEAAAEAEKRRILDEEAEKERRTEIAGSELPLFPASRETTLSMGDDL